MKVAITGTTGFTGRALCNNLASKATHGYKGKRLYLTKTEQETDVDLINSMRRKPDKYEESDLKKYLVYFSVDKIRPLIGE